MTPKENEMRVLTIRGEMAKELENALDNERIISYYIIEECGRKVIDVYVQVPAKK